MVRLNPPRRIPKATHPNDIGVAQRGIPDRHFCQGTGYVVAGRRIAGTRYRGRIQPCRRTVNDVRAPVPAVQVRSTQRRAVNHAAGVMPSVQSGSDGAAGCAGSGGVGQGYDFPADVDTEGERLVSDAAVSYVDHVLDCVVGVHVEPARERQGKVARHGTAVLQVFTGRIIE